MPDWIARWGMDIGPIASWVMLVTQFVIVPVVVWLRQQLRVPMQRLEERLEQQRRTLQRMHATVEGLAQHVARQNGRIGALETRFTEHTTQDHQQQARLHEDLRTLYLHLAAPLPKRE